MTTPVPFSPVAIVPVYNHPATIGRMVQGVLRAGLRCILVDDGSEPGCAAVLDALAAQHGPQVTLLRLPQNQGKGGAVMTGMRHALAAGYSHALQIDADGQHDVADIPAFIALARAHPQAMVCGAPRYDASVPKARLYGRYATHVWVWINTLSLDIEDSMCGFRVYPLREAIGVMDRARIGKHMEFDTEILVRMHWKGVPFITQRTAVTYPQDGLSHFRVWRDNMLISGMHTRLFGGMLLRSPVLLARKLRGWCRSGKAA
jgi:glycosyltransferase involved in cell wall biosynthesis